MSAVWKVLRKTNKSNIYSNLLHIRTCSYQVVRNVGILRSEIKLRT